MQPLRNLFSQHTTARRLRAAQQRLDPILNDPTPPACYDADAIFAQLMHEHSPRRGYRYDAAASLQRGTDRTARLARRLATTPTTALEIGCGDGMTAVVLAWQGTQVQLVDQADWRDRRARGLPFVQADVCNDAPLQVANASFDLVFSYNTFEHLPDPTRAFAEAMRVCCSGGHLYLKFGPLYASAWGLHAYHTVAIPYAQFIFSPEFIAQKLASIGINDLGSKREALQYLNGWRLADYQALWQRDDCTVVHQQTKLDIDELALVERFPRAFSGRGLTSVDLVTKNIEVLIRKQ